MAQIPVLPALHLGKGGLAGPVVADDHPGGLRGCNVGGGAISWVGTDGNCEQLAVRDCEVAQAHEVDRQREITVSFRAEIDGASLVRICVR